MRSGLAIRARRPSFSRGDTWRMTHHRFTLPGTAWLCLAAAGLLAQGCAPGAGSGFYPSDLEGGARGCAVSAVNPADGSAVAVPMRVSNEGGWCGISTVRGGVPYDAYLLVVRPMHGKVFAHRVGGATRIDYSPDAGYAGADAFAVRLIPGNAVIQGGVTVTR